MEDIIPHRRLLEQSIAVLLEQFEKQNGVVVESVYIDNSAEYIGSAPRRVVRVSHTPRPGTQWR